MKEVLEEHEAWFGKASNPITGPESSRRLRLPDFKTIGT
jgi:hypothetical protein